MGIKFIKKKKGEVVAANVPADLKTTVDKDGNVVTDMLHENYPKYESICVETLGK